MFRTYFVALIIGVSFASATYADSPTMTIMPATEGGVSMDVVETPLPPPPPPYSIHPVRRGTTVEQFATGTLDNEGNVVPIVEATMNLTPSAEGTQAIVGADGRILQVVGVNDSNLSLPVTGGLGGLHVKQDAVGARVLADMILPVSGEAGSIVQKACINCMIGTSSPPTQD